MDTATTRRVSVTPPATLLWGWAPLLLGVSPRLRQRPCSGAGRRYHSACLLESASDPARGLGAATTRRVSATPPATLLGGWAPLPLGVSARPRQRPCSGAGRRYHSACLRDSASDPARGLGAATTQCVSATPPAALLGGWAPLPLGVSPRLHQRPCLGAGRHDFRVEWIWSDKRSGNNK